MSLRAKMGWRMRTVKTTTSKGTPDSDLRRMVSYEFGVVHLGSDTFRLERQGRFGVAGLRHGIT
jgi:hypothetical protein